MNIVKILAGQCGPALGKSSIRHRLLAISFLLWAGGLATSAALAENVTGAVTDVRKTVSFEGAIVRLEELARSGISDERGRFRLTNVPAGDYTLVISYVGAEDTRIEISVPEAGLDLGEVSIGGGTELIEEVIVYGQAAAIASALNQERSSLNLVSVLDTDAMGQFPDQNVAESVRRLSGVSVENDQGEGRYVVIRGMDPDLNSTSINGVRATAGEDRRALQLDVIPSDVLDGIEVHKTLTPDMDGDAIGGSINVRTLSAFSRKGPYVKVRAEGSYNELREEWSPKMSFAGSNIFELSNGKRLGVAGALSWNDRQLAADNNEADDWDQADNGADFIEEFQPRLYTVDRERIGAVLNLDLDVSSTTSLHLYTLYSEFTDTELRNRLTIALDDLNDATVSSEYAEYGAAELERDTKDRDQIAENLSISFGSDTQAGDWSITTNFGYNYAKEDTPDQVSAVYVAEFESGDGPIPEGAPVLAMNHSNNQTPVVESAFESALYDASRYELDEIAHEEFVNEDTQYSLRVDASKETGFGSIQFGAKARYREKKTDEEVALWSGDGTWYLSDVPCPGCADQYGLPQPMNPVPETGGIRTILANRTGLEFEEVDSEIDSNVADFVINEDVLAIYGLAQWDSGPLVVTAGMRVEYTEFESEGNLTELIEEGDEVNGVALEDDTVFLSPVQESSSYTDLLPSANLRYEFNEGLIGRASMHRSVVRPRVEEVAFRASADGGEIELGNPSLDPFRAWNADASLSCYPTELSVLSAGIFWKQIEDFIFVQTIDDFAFAGKTYDEAAIALNGDDADVLGLEFNYQQHFGFLGAPWDAFLVAMNYTYVDTEAETDGRDIDLPKQSKNIASFVLGYDKHGLDLRLAMKYRDSYIDSLEGEGDDRYTDEHLQWDFTAKYRFNDSWQVYVEIANLGDEPEYYYAGRSSRVLQYDEFGTTTAIGVQFNFQ